jgi:hypothetical protein
MGNKQETPKMSDGELLNEVVNLLAEEERYVQAITALLTFGVFKYIVFPSLSYLPQSFWKIRLNKWSFKNKYFS